MLEVKQKVVRLKGITMRGSFQIFNPNENLAVIFELAPSRIGIEIEPKRGIMMQREIKTIKVWIKDERANSGLADLSIALSMTMKTEYNRKMFNKLQLKGWDQVSQSYETLTLPLIIEETRVNRNAHYQDPQRSYSRDSYLRESQRLTMGFEEGKVYSSSYQGIKSSQVSKKSRLDDELNYLFQKGNVSGEKSRNRSPSMEIFQSVRGPDRGKRQISRISSTVSHVRDNQDNNQRFMEIILLAALAGFFLALGSNFKNLIF